MGRGSRRTADDARPGYGSGDDVFPLPAGRVPLWESGLDPQGQITAPHSCGAAAAGCGIPVPKGDRAQGPAGADVPHPAAAAPQLWGSVLTLGVQATLP